jgi:uncharacterized membrane protein YdbT with pleckstrin-like domain
MANTYLESLLGENERILVTARQHWFILAAEIALEVSVVLFVFGGIIYAIYTNPDIAVVFSLLGFFLLLLPIGSMVRDILLWSHHEYIITNWRVVQVSGVINKNVIDSNLEKVNDVKMSQSIIGRLFDFGDIEILTASEMGNNLFKRIDQPVRFKTAMINAKEALERRHEGLPELNNASDPTSVLARLAELKEKGVVTEEEFKAKKAELLAKIK